MKLRQGPKLKKLKTGQQILLDALWYKHGGLRACAKKIGEGCEDFHLSSWRKRDGVPHNWVMTVARALDVPRVALNYRDLGFFLADEGSWRDVVKQCKFSKEIETRILKAPEPVL